MRTELFDSIDDRAVHFGRCLEGQRERIDRAVLRGTLGQQIERDAEIGTRTEFEDPLARELRCCGRAGVPLDDVQPFVDDLDVVVHAPLDVAGRERASPVVPLGEVLGFRHGQESHAERAVKGIV